MQLHAYMHAYHAKACYNNDGCISISECFGHAHKSLDHALDAAVCVDYHVPPDSRTFEDYKIDGGLTMAWLTAGAGP